MAPTLKLKTPMKIKTLVACGLFVNLLICWFIGLLDCQAYIESCMFLSYKGLHDCMASLTHYLGVYIHCQSCQKITMRGNNFMNSPLSFIIFSNGKKTHCGIVQREIVPLCLKI